MKYNPNMTDLQFNEWCEENNIHFPLSEEDFLNVFKLARKIAEKVYENKNSSIIKEDQFPLSGEKPETD